MVCPPAAWGTHLVHFTGSKEHNVALRGRALDRGLSLSEKGFKVVESGELLRGGDRGGRLRAPRPGLGRRPSCARATARSRPRRRHACRTSSRVADLRGDTHVHSDWTDGVDTIESMARAARDAGREWMVLTDHSPSLGIARGLDPARVEAQRAEIARLNATLAPFRILHGTEMEIRADGAPRLSRRAARALRRRHRKHPHRSRPADGAADAARAGGDREPARRRAGASVRPDRRAARSAAARLAARVRGGGRAPARCSRSTAARGSTCRHACAGRPRAPARASPSRRTRTAPRSSTSSLRRRRGAAGGARRRSRSRRPSAPTRCWSCVR